MKDGIALFIQRGSIRFALQKILDAFAFQVGSSGVVQRCAAVRVLQSDAGADAGQRVHALVMGLTSRVM